MQSCQLFFDVDPVCFISCFSPPIKTLFRVQYRTNTVDTCHGSEVCRH